MTQLLRLKNLHIDTYKETVVYTHKNSPICHSEGFEIRARIQVRLNNKTIIATLNTIDDDLLGIDEASLSSCAWKYLAAEEGDFIHLEHPTHLVSQDIILDKINGISLQEEDAKHIIQDLVAGYLSDIHIAAFLAVCANNHLTQKEIYWITKAMVEAGEHIKWDSSFIVDKHCVGGLPGNRTSIIVVPIVAAFGLKMPKTSSRAITSPSGTADTMEVLAPVNLDIDAMRRVVEQENGCIVWGGAVELSPADDLFIRIEKALNLDGDGQLVASVLSKKIAAGSTHIVLDIPIGNTAKVRSIQKAESLKRNFEAIGKRFGLTLKIVFSDGEQPIGHGIGPALEAKDVLAVLQCLPNAPQDLREHALTLAGQVLEFSTAILPGTGKTVATEILDSGKAYKKFKAICLAQGEMRTPPTANFQHGITASRAGRILSINNQYLATLAKLAGAPTYKAAGIELKISLGEPVIKEQLLYVIHAETQSALDYALKYVEQDRKIIEISELSQ